MLAILTPETKCFKKGQTVADGKVELTRYGLEPVMIKQAGSTLNSEASGPPVREEAIGSNVTCHDLPVCSSLKLC